MTTLKDRLETLCSTGILQTADEGRFALHIGIKYTDGTCEFLSASRPAQPVNDKVVKEISIQLTKVKEYAKKLIPEIL
jgi:hypothetical protein|tara:strand:+ start:234 stop:467 length:234 start_codon:yes stop_codon:yes gene_type:complete